jgi:hypothetical protein
VLKNYDVVLLVNSSARFHYAEPELHAIEKFVEEGGGLLVICNAAAMTMEAGEFPFHIRVLQKTCEELWNRRYVHAALEEMPLNAALRLFGLRIVNHRSHGENLTIHKHPSISIPEDRTLVRRLRLSSFTLVAPEDAHILIEDKDGGAVGGVAHLYGKGRVVVFAEPSLFSPSAVQRLAQNWVQGMVKWLATGQLSEGSGVSEIPALIDAENYEKHIDGLTIRSNDFTKEAVPLISRYAKSIADDDRAYLGFRSCPLTLTLWAGGDAGGASGRHVDISCLSSNAAIIGEIGHEMAHAILLSSSPYYAYGPPRWFVEGATAQYLAIRALRATGFNEEARDFYNLTWQVIQNERAGKKVDISKNANAYHPKATWVMDVLERRYGPSFLRRFCHFPADARDSFPFVEANRILIYYLSRTAGEDLFPFFSAIGTTVDPLPILPEAAPELRREVSKQLSAQFARTGITLPEKIEIAGHVARLDTESAEAITFLRNSMNDTRSGLGSRIDAARGLMMGPLPQKEEARSFLAEIIGDEARGVYRRSYAAMRQPDEKERISLLRNLGFIPDADWVACGPFDKDSLDTNIPREIEAQSQGIDIETTYSDKGIVRSWSPVRGNPVDHQIGFGSVNNETANGGTTGYVLTRFHSPIGRDAQLRISSDCKLTVWVNGRLIPVDNKKRGWSWTGGPMFAEGGRYAFYVGVIDQENIPVRLREGTNDLLVRLDLTTDSQLGVFNCRMADTKGRPFDDVQPTRLGIRSDQNKRNGESPVSAEKQSTHVAHEKLPPVDAESLFSQFMKDETLPLSFRAMAAHMLLKMGVNEGRDFLVGLLKGSSLGIEERIIVASTLAYSGVKEGIEELEKRSGDESLTDSLRATLTQEIEEIRRSR